MTGFLFSYCSIIFYSGFYQKERMEFIYSAEMQLKILNAIDKSE